MDFQTWKETFEDELKDDHGKSGSKMSFDNWTQSLWDKRMAEIEIEAYEYDHLI